MFQRASWPRMSFAFISLGKSCKRITNTAPLSEVAMAAQGSNTLALARPAARIGRFSKYLLFS